MNKASQSVTVQKNSQGIAKSLNISPFIKGKDQSKSVQLDEKQANSTLTTPVKVDKSKDFIKTTAGGLEAPVGQDKNAFRNEKKTKMHLRFEFDNKVEKHMKKDVHEGTSVNPMISQEVNQNDPQIKEIIKHLQKALKMTHDEAESFIEKYAKDVT